MKVPYNGRRESQNGKNRRFGQFTQLASYGLAVKKLKKAQYDPFISGTKGRLLLKNGYANLVAHRNRLIILLRGCKRLVQTKICVT